MSRHDRVQAALKREISIILHDEMNDPRLGFVNINRVELSQNLRFVKVFYGVLGQDQDYQKTQAALDSALGFIRKLVAERINLRIAPEIAFYEDRSSEHSIRIQEVLDEIKELRPSQKEEPGVKIRKDGRGEPKKSSRTHKKK